MAPKIDINLVSTVFEGIAGADYASDGAVFCRAAADSTERLVKRECITPENMYSICYAAGCLAAYRLRLKLSFDPSPSFTAGDVRVLESGTSADAARALYEEAMRAISHLLRRGDGTLLSVRGKV